MINVIKYSLVRIIEKYPIFHTLIYNNIDKFKFLFPHEKDYLGLKLIFNSNFQGDFLDIGGNIGLSTIGFRSLGFKKNKIYIFEPNTKNCQNKLSLLKRKDKKIFILNFGLSSKNKNINLYTPIYKKKSFHFLSSSDKSYVTSKLKYHYREKYQNFKLTAQKIKLKKFDSLKKKINPKFIKIDVEGHDHEVIKGMMISIKKNLPVILIEYNKENFFEIYKLLKKIYNSYLYDINLNKLIMLNKKQIKLLVNGKMKKNFYLGQRNIFFLPKLQK